MNNLKNKTIWITGASDGIGKELAYQLAREGAKIVLTARSQDKLEAIKKDLHGQGHQVLPMDLLKTAAIPDTVQHLLSHTDVDVVIHSAGISQRSLVKDTSVEVDRRIMELDYFSIVYITKALLPHFIKKQSGCIVALSSIAGKLGTPMRSAYCAAKHALQGFMDSLRAEVHNDHIEVLVVTPGSIKTNISVNAVEGDGSKHGVTDAAIANGMSVEDCASQIISGIKNNKQEILIAKGKERLATYVKRFFPKLIFKMVRSVQST